MPDEVKDVRMNHEVQQPSSSIEAKEVNEAACEQSSDQEDESPWGIVPNDDDHKNIYRQFLSLCINDRNCASRWVTDHSPRTASFPPKYQRLAQCVFDTWQRDEVLVTRDTYQAHLDSLRVSKIERISESANYSRVANFSWAKADDFPMLVRKIIEDHRKLVEQQNLLSILKVIQHNGNRPSPADYSRIRYLADKGAELAGACSDMIPVAHARNYAASEIGNRDLFVDVYGGNLRFVTAWGKWLHWNGQRWEPDETNKVRNLACDLVKDAMPDIAKTIDNDEQRTRWMKWVAVSQSRNRIDSMIYLAQSVIAVTPRELDADPWLMNLKNGTLDLRTGELRPANKSDLITKIGPADFDPKATCPVWEKFVNRIFQTADGEDRPELVKYVQRAAGYTLTGDVSEQVLFIAHGRGRNGKTTFLDILKFIMGDYAITAQQQLLLLGREKSNSEDVTNLMGARLATCSETNEGQRFNESLVKSLVGSGTIRARRLYENSYEFTPTHKIWMDCNHLPQIHGTDCGIRRRIKQIPFALEIPPKERDLRLKEKLLKESSGILNWMLVGLKAWREHGLSEPQCVTDAIKEYLNDSDLLGQFLSETTRDNPVGRIASSRLYSMYTYWCGENGLDHPLTQMALARKLKERGYSFTASNGVRYCTGLEQVTVDDNSNCDWLNNWNATKRE